MTDIERAVALHFADELMGETGKAGKAGSA